MLRSNLFRFKPSFQLQKILKHSTQAASPRTTVTNSEAEINSFKVNEKLHGFIVYDIQDVPEFHLKAVRLAHEQTKADYLHLYRADNNNTFSINFRTTPKDDTGSPHILEHTVLCGSQLYPIRDPFFKMLHRSLATFINAMTGSDFTMYPFSTQNFLDYQNLQKVYLDAVFRPNLKLLDFMQEGWRFEYSNPNDKNTNLIIKGVVYNEMKGVFSENERLLEQKIQNLILPDHTYGFVSGGDPQKIPYLTWKNLKMFHKQHYHPSNARFYSYGNFSLTPTLKYLNDEYLSKYNYEETNHTLVPKQTRWSESKTAELKCRFENMRGPIEKQNFISASILMSDIMDVYDTFVIQFITELLIRGPNAPFYKSMIEPNISGGFTQTTGFDAQVRDSIFTLGLQGIDKNDFNKFLALFDETIHEVIKTGFDEKHIESVLHRYELSIKHETSNFGLNLLFGITPLWNHQGNIISALKVNNLIDRLKREISTDKQYLQNIIKKHFRDNTHRLTLTMSADHQFEKKQAALEAELIAEKTKSLTEQDKEKIYMNGLQLQEEQTKKLDTNILPTLQIDDINNDVERIPRLKFSYGPVPTQLNSVNSNEITYFRGVLNTGELTPEQKMLLPLFCYVIPKMDTKSMTYREFDSLVNRKTGGLNLEVHIGDSLYQLHSYECGILLSSYCLDKNIDSMWELWSQLFQTTTFNDVARFETLLKLYMADLTQNIVSYGHQYAIQAASALVSGSGYQRELLTGLHHILYMKRLLQISNYKGILKEISNIATTLFDKKKLRGCLNISKANQGTIVKSYEKFIAQLPGSALGLPDKNVYSSSKVWTSTDSINCQHHVLNASVNFCGKAILTVPYTNQDFATLQVLSKLLTAKYLHPEIREKNGAYGGGCKLGVDGVFTFYSYRDPRNLETLDVFDNSARWLETELDKITEQEILEAKLGIFQIVDAPIPPSSKGVKEFLIGLTPDILQRHRAELMAVDLDGLKKAGSKYLRNKLPSSNGKVILGPKSEHSDMKNRPDELWTVIDS